VISRPFRHTQTEWFQAPVQRFASPFFAPPMVSGAREPGTDYLGIITAENGYTLKQG